MREEVAAGRIADTGVRRPHEFDVCQYRPMSKSEWSLTNASDCEFVQLVREPLAAEAADEAAAILKALADPVRLRLFSSVASHAGGEACVCDISADIDVSQPTISHHLKVLRDAGLLVAERRASWVYYSVVPETIRKLSALFSIADRPSNEGVHA